MELVPGRGGLVKSNAFFRAMDRAGGVHGVVLEKQGPFFRGRRLQEQLFFFQREQGARVVPHNVGQRDVPRAWKQIGHEGRGLALVVPEQRDHLAFSVAICEENVPPFDAHGVPCHTSCALHHSQLP